MTEPPNAANADDPAGQPPLSGQPSPAGEPAPQGPGSPSLPGPTTPPGPYDAVGPAPQSSPYDAVGPAPQPSPYDAVGPYGSGGPYGATGPYGSGGPYDTPGQYPQGGLPAGGYVVPPPSPEMYGDPLISPDYGGWWQRTIALIKRGLKPLIVLQSIGLVIGLALQIPIGIYSAFVAKDLEDLTTSSSEPPTAADFGPLFAGLGFSMLSAACLMIVSAVVTLATIYAAVMIATGVQPSVGAALRGAARRAFPLIGWQLLAGLIIFAGICACVLPMFYFMAVFAVLPAVVACERGGVIGRSFRLFHGDLGASLARVATIFGLSLGGGMIGALLGLVLNEGATRGLGGSAGLVLGSVVSTGFTLIISAAVAVVTAPLTLTTYADMRARIEPLSTGVLAMELGLASPPAAGPAGATG